MQELSRSCGGARTSWRRERKRERHGRRIRRGRTTATVQAICVSVHTGFWVQVMTREHHACGAGKSPGVQLAGEHVHMSQFAKRTVSEPWWTADGEAPEFEANTQRPICGQYWVYSLNIGGILFQILTEHYFNNTADIGQILAAYFLSLTSYILIFLVPIRFQVLNTN